MTDDRLTGDRLTGDRLTGAARLAQRHEKWVERSVWLVLAAGVLGFVARGADRPPDPYLTRPADARVERQPLDGFGEIAFRITGPAGQASRLCALLADDQEARRRGLMKQTSMRGYDAMIFRFPEPSTSPFYMYNTPMPLSVAFFDADGRFVSATAMEPCPETDPDACPRHPPEAPYVYAMEVPADSLVHLLLGPGSTLSFPEGRCA